MSLHGCLTNLFDRRSAHAQAFSSIIERNGKVGLKSREVENNGRHLVMEEMSMRMLVDVFEARTCTGPAGCCKVCVCVHDWITCTCALVLVACIHSFI
jgi:hypothetical protein